MIGLLSSICIFISDHSYSEITTIPCIRPWKPAAKFLDVFTCWWPTVLHSLVTSDGSRGGVLGNRFPLFWIKKKIIAAGRNADRASKTHSFPRALLAQGLYPPLLTSLRTVKHRLTALIAVISGLTCKRGDSVNSALCWPFRLVCVPF